MTEALGPAALRERLEAHSTGTVALVAVLALVVGTYAAWLGGDYGLGTGSLVGFALVVAYVLVQQPTGRAVAARGCVLLAGLLLVTPVFLNLPVFTGDHAGVADPAALVFHPGTYAMAAVFVVLAVVVGAVGLRLDDR